MYTKKLIEMPKQNTQKMCLNEFPKPRVSNTNIVQYKITIKIIQIHFAAVKR